MKLVNCLPCSNVAVNGKLMKLVDDSTLPNVDPVVVSAGNDIIIPEASFGFIILPDSRALACT